MKVLLWNLRFRLAWAILPGAHKHVSVRDVNEECDRCHVHDDSCCGNFE